MRLVCWQCLWPRAQDQRSKTKRVKSKKSPRLNQKQNPLPKIPGCRPAGGPGTCWGTSGTVTRVAICNLLFTLAETREAPGLTTLSFVTPPLTVASAREVDSSRSALELPDSCADAAPSDAACTLVPAVTQHAAPPATCLLPPSRWPVPCTSSPSSRRCPTSSSPQLHPPAAAPSHPGTPWSRRSKCQCRL